jgi:hypothetical protein
MERLSPYRKPDEHFTFSDYLGVQAGLDEIFCGIIRDEADHRRKTLDNYPESTYHMIRTTP